MRTRRRIFRRSHRRRSSRNDLLPLSLCDTRTSFDALGDFDCTDPNNVQSEFFIFPELTGTLGRPGVPANATERIGDSRLEKLSRGMKLRGIKFMVNLDSQVLVYSSSLGWPSYTSTVTHRMAWVKVTYDSQGMALDPNFVSRFNLFDPAETNKYDILWRHQACIDYRGVNMGDLAALDPLNYPFVWNDTRWSREFNVRTRRNLNEQEAVIFVLQTWWNQGVLQEAGVQNGYHLSIFGFSAVKNWMK